MWYYQFERKVKLSISFLPSWYYHNYGMDFGERYVFDPEYRIRLDVERERLLYERFGDLGLGEDSPKPKPDLWCVNGTIPALFGASLFFQKDKFPWDVPANLSEEACASLRVPDIENTFPTREFIRQTEYFMKYYNAPATLPACQGVLNNALKVRGNQFMVDIGINRPLAHRILEVMCETLITVIQYWCNRFKMRDHLPVTVANCVVHMISPKMYHELIFPYDQRIQRTFGQFGIHHCGRIDEYLLEYKRHTLDFLEVGHLSNLRRIRAIFPDLEVGRLVDPSFLLRADASTVHKHIRTLMREGEPLDKLCIDCADVEYGTPDENIRAIFAAITDQ